LIFKNKKQKQDGKKKNTPIDRFQTFPDRQAICRFLLAKQHPDIGYSFIRRFPDAA